MLEAEIEQLVEQIDKLAASPGPTLGGSPNFLRPKAPVMPKPPCSGGDTAFRRPQASRSRPSTAGSRPLTAGSRPSTASCGSGGSDSNRAVEEIGGSLNALDVDKVRARLQEILREERDALLEDINYLQECLQDEMDGAAGGGRRPGGVLGQSEEDAGRTQGALSASAKAG